MPFDAVVAYDVGSNYSRIKGAKGNVKKVAIVTYGNGVRAALQYAHMQSREWNEREEQEQVLHITVIDSPCISQTPAQLPPLLTRQPPPLFFPPPPPSFSH